MIYNSKEFVGKALYVVIVVFVGSCEYIKRAQQEDISDQTQPSKIDDIEEPQAALHPLEAFEHSKSCLQTQNHCKPFFADTN